MSSSANLNLSSVVNMLEIESLLKDKNAKYIFFTRDFEGLCSSILSNTDYTYLEGEHRVFITKETGEKTAVCKMRGQDLVDFLHIEISFSSEGAWNKYKIGATKQASKVHYLDKNDKFKIITLSRSRQILRVIIQERFRKETIKLIKDVKINASYNKKQFAGNAKIRSCAKQA